jgi:hypothetical protein
MRDVTDEDFFYEEAMIWDIQNVSSSKSLSVNYNLTYEDLYKWNCYSVDNSSQYSAWYPYNYTLNQTMNLSIGLSAGVSFRFYPNQTVINATVPINQSATKGSFNITNNGIYNITLYGLLNETNTNVTLRIYHLNQWNNSIRLNTTRQDILTCFAPNHTYLWMWADFIGTTTRWNPRFDLIGEYC